MVMGKVLEVCWIFIYLFFILGQEDLLGITQSIVTSF